MSVNADYCRQRAENAANSFDKEYWLKMLEHWLKMATAEDAADAENESVAREIVTSSALRSPSADQIRLANEGDLAIGKEATLVAADFSVEKDSIKLIGVEEQR